MITYSKNEGSVSTTSPEVSVLQATWSMRRLDTIQKSKPVSHADMMKRAKASPPPQSWFEEDVTALRKPQK